MCGIAGFFVPNSGRGPDELRQRAGAMASALVHRGPDAEGLWVDAQTGVGFAHRRLKVIDLSEAASQPMVSHSGRFVLAFNGEIYNFKEIRKQLPAVHWRGDSDTEVLLAAIDHWGLERAVAASVGMFAFALWDRQEKQLNLVRDRLGVKPLFYGVMSDGSFAFGSELKVLMAHLHKPSISQVRWSS